MAYVYQGAPSNLAATSSADGQVFITTGMSTWCHGALLRHSGLRLLSRNQGSSLNGEISGEDCTMFDLMDSRERSLNEHLSCNERVCSKSVFLRQALFTLALDKCYGSVCNWRPARSIPILPFEYCPRLFKGLDPAVDGKGIPRDLGPTHIDNDRFDAYCLWIRSPHHIWNRIIA